MILVRMVLQAEWGKAPEVVKAFSQGAPLFRRLAGPNAHVRLLTDLTGPFDTVVQEIEVESMAEWERVRAALFADPEFQQSGATEAMLLRGGSLEIYTIEATF